MALDTNETKNSLFGGLAKGGKKKDPIESNEKNTPDTVISRNEYKAPPSEPISTQTKPKYQTFDKVTALLTSKQKEGLDRVAKRIMKQRADLTKREDKERITANTIIRSLIDNFLENEESVKHEIISSEQEVYEWIKKMFKN